MRFVTFRLILLILPLLAQIYLFTRVRKAILSFHRSHAFKSCAMSLVILAMGTLFAVNVYTLIRPITWEPIPIARAVLFYPVAVWSLASIFSALLLVLLEIAWGLAKSVARFSCMPSGSEPLSQPDPDRRLFLQFAAAGIASTPFIISGYGAAYGSAAYEVRELTLPFGRSMRLVQLSDIHAGVYMTREDIGRYADKIIKLDPDLFVITGDFISNSITFLPGCLAELARVRPTYGTYAAVGNHERYFGKPAEVRSIFRHYKIPLLVNANRVIDTKGGPFAVAAIDDLRNGHPRLDYALRGIDPATPIILLSHRPEIFPRAAGNGVRLTLSGHYHGGQIKIAGMSLAHLRTVYPEGLYRMPDSHLYVSRGIGTTFTPVRINVPPEITVLNLT